MTAVRHHRLCATARDFPCDCVPDPPALPQPRPADHHARRGSNVGRDHITKAPEPVVGAHKATALDWLAPTLMLLLGLIAAGVVTLIALKGVPR